MVSVNTSSFLFNNPHCCSYKRIEKGDKTLFLSNCWTPGCSQNFQILPSIGRLRRLFTQLCHYVGKCDKATTKWRTINKLGGNPFRLKLVLVMHRRTWHVIFIGCSNCCWNFSRFFWLNYPFCALFLFFQEFPLNTACNSSSLMDVFGLFLVCVIFPYVQLNKVIWINMS